MYDCKFTDAELIAALEAGISKAQFARDKNVHLRTVGYRHAKLIKRGYSPSNNYTHIVPDGFKVKGVSQYYNQNGQVTGQWVKSTEDKERQFELLTEMCQGFIKDLPKLIPTTIMNGHLICEDLLAVYPLGDPHIGMLSWDKETGENWDLKIAEKTLCAMFDRVVRTAPNCKECLIINLGDFFHTDNMEGVTTRSGNHLDKDGRYAKMVSVGVKIIRQMITTALEVHETVRVINCVGNHDDTSSLFLNIALKHIYENEPRVIIEDNTSPFNYYKWGKVLLGAHHGHTCKMDKLPSVMAADKYKEWGQTKFRYWLTGHIHKDSKIADEYGGCFVESFRTMAAKDMYATAGGWRSGRDTKCIVYHKEYGECERHTIHISQI